MLSLGMGPNLIPEMSSVVTPRLEDRNLANDILASLSSSEPFKDNSSSFTLVRLFLYFSGQYHIFNHKILNEVFADSHLSFLRKRNSK